MKAPYVLAALASLLVLSDAQAQAPAYASRCGESSSTVQTNACLSREYRRVDAELNRVYQRVLTFAREAERPAVIKTRTLRNLRDAQRLWIQVRDRTCNGVELHWMGGSGQMAAFLNCQIQLTEDRTRVLRDVFGLQD